MKTESVKKLTAEELLEDHHRRLNEGESVVITPLSDLADGEAMRYHEILFNHLFEDQDDEDHDTCISVVYHVECRFPRLEEYVFLQTFDKYHESEKLAYDTAIIFLRKLHDAIFDPEIDSDRSIQKSVMNATTEEDFEDALHSVWAAYEDKYSFDEGGDNLWGVWIDDVRVFP
jgi:hypothetical protein